MSRGSGERFCRRYRGFTLLPHLIHGLTAEAMILRRCRGLTEIGEIRGWFGCKLA